MNNFKMKKLAERKSRGITDLIILAYLQKNGPIHIYEMRKGIHNEIPVLMNNSRIYPACWKMRDMGLLKSYEHMNNGRQTYVYEITKEGEEYFNDLGARMSPIFAYIQSTLDKNGLKDTSIVLYPRVCSKSK